MSEDDSDLWIVLAVIQEFKLDSVTLALEQLPGFGGMTVSDCRGFGQEKMHNASQAHDAGSQSQVSSGVVDFTPKVKLEVAVATRKDADSIVETIARVAHTGRRGDGKIFVWPLTRALRIRTMENDRDAIGSSTRNATRRE